MSNNKYKILSDISHNKYPITTYTCIKTVKSYQDFSFCHCLYTLDSCVFGNHEFECNTFLYINGNMYIVYL